MPLKLVIDANIVIAAALGRSWPLLREVADRAHVILPQRALDESVKVTARLIGDEPNVKRQLAELEGITYVQPMTYPDGIEEIARWLLGDDRAKDWPILATAMLHEAPIWTKDRDFNGTGVGTWNNRTVIHYLEGRKLAGRR